jgi:uncharacterized protein (UPF0333 family)
MKRGQFQLSYGFIFSVILIGVFLFVAFFAISSFLDLSSSVNTGIFISDLQKDVTRIWNGAGEESVYTYELDEGKLTHICFYNNTKTIYGGDIQIGRKLLESYQTNLYFYPQRFAKVPSTEIKHINMEGFNRNPYCVEIIDGKIKLKLEKGLRDTLVTISENE